MYNSQGQPASRFVEKRRHVARHLSTATIAQVFGPLSKPVPVFQQARTSPNRTKSISNIQQLNAATMSSPQCNVFVGRQQIYDCDLNVMAYELLFRSSNENRATYEDEDVATSQLLVNALVEIGLENLVFRRPAFVNFSRNFIVGKCEIPFDSEQLVIELQDSIKPDPEIMAALKSLRDVGYTIALGGYVENDKRQELLGVVDIIKFDLRNFRAAKLAQEVNQLKKLPVKLLAEKVETTEQFERCKELGFDYFQGYFLSRPQVVEGTTIASNKIAILRLLVNLRDPQVTFDDIVDLVKQDVSLSLMLLRYVNSAEQGVRRQGNGKRLPYRRSIDP